MTSRPRVVAQEHRDAVRRSPSQRRLHPLRGLIGIPPGSVLHRVQVGAVDGGSMSGRAAILPLDARNSPTERRLMMSVSLSPRS